MGMVGLIFVPQPFLKQDQRNISRCSNDIDWTFWHLLVSDFKIFHEQTSPGLEDSMVYPGYIQYKWYIADHNFLIQCFAPDKVGFGILIWQGLMWTNFSCMLSGFILKFWQSHFGRKLFDTADSEFLQYYTVIHCWLLWLLTIPGKVV